MVLSVIPLTGFVGLAKSAVFVRREEASRVPRVPTKPTSNTVLGRKFVLGVEAVLLNHWRIVVFGYVVRRKSRIKRACRKKWRAPEAD